MTFALLFAAGTFVAALAVWLALDATFQLVLNQGQDVISTSVTIATDSKEYAEIAVAAGATVNFTIGMDPDNVAAYVLLADFAGTLTTTNAAGAPDVLTLAANEPLAWNNKMGLAKHFANADAWTSWAVHNAGAADGTLRVLIMRDGTP